MSKSIISIITVLLVFFQAMLTSATMDTVRLITPREGQNIAAGATIHAVAQGGSQSSTATFIVTSLDGTYNQAQTGSYLTMKAPSEAFFYADFLLPLSATAGTYTVSVILDTGDTPTVASVNVIVLNNQIPNCFNPSYNSCNNGCRYYETEEELYTPFELEDVSCN